jgi:hypothetical protein
MSREIIREINLNLNTKHRDASSTLSLPSWTLSVPITPKHRQSCFEIMVRSISLPKAFFYSFVDQTATWQRTVGGVPTGTTIVYNLATGNHTIAELQVFMKTWECYANSTTSVTLSGPTNTLSLNGVTTTFPGNGNGIITLTETLAEALNLPTSYVVVPSSRRTSGPVDNVLSRSLYVLCHMGVTDCYSAVLVPFRESKIICRFPMVSTQSIAAAFDYEFPVPTAASMVDQTISVIQLSLATEQFAKLDVLLDYSITLSLYEILKPNEVEDAPSIRISDLLIGSSAASTDEHMGASDEDILRDAAKVLKANRELQKEQSQ